MTPRVTVLIPAYNAQKYIADAIGSVLVQSFTEFEIVVVNDGSSDGTAKVLAAVGDPRLRVLAQENAGTVAALNAGLAVARGEYVARLDADDMMTQGRLAAEVRALDDDPSLVLVGSDYRMFGLVEARVRMPRSDTACRARMLLAGSHCGAAITFRRETAERFELRFDPDYRHGEDYKFVSTIAKYGQVRNLPRVGLEYRQHGDQDSYRSAQGQRIVHRRIAAENAVAQGTRPLADVDIDRLLFPVIEPGGGPVRALRTMTSTLPSAFRAVHRKPAAETVRFALRKVYEAAARTYHADCEAEAGGLS